MEVIERSYPDNDFAGDPRDFHVIAVFEGHHLDVNPES
jgi:hypothetical protein